MITLPGLLSRCTIPTWWAACSVRAADSMNATTRAMSVGRALRESSAALAGSSMLAPSMSRAAAE
jgi:hypothetical protein